MSNDLTLKNGNILQRLANQIIARIEKVGGEITLTDLVDFTARVQGQIYIFKLEILDQDAHTQLGNAMNKIYEFAYLNQLDRTNSAIVTNTKVVQKLLWIYDFLEQDRNIRVLWFDGNNELQASPETREKLAFLWDD